MNCWLSQPPLNVIGSGQASTWTRSYKLPAACFPLSTHDFSSYGKGRCRHAVLSEAESGGSNCRQRFVVILSTEWKLELTPLDPPKFDLESYISNYDGFTRADRLRHIGSHSTYLAVDAYRIAIAEAKRGKNVKLYLDLVDEFAQIAPDDPAALTDTTWATEKTKKVEVEKEKLEHELKSYKNNMIKESIRVSSGY